MKSAKTMITEALQEISNKHGVNIQTLSANWINADDISDTCNQHRIVRSVKIECLIIDAINGDFDD